MKSDLSDDLSVDFETFSTVDLRKTGIYPYMRHPSTEPLCMAYAYVGNEPKLWLPGEPCPDEVLDTIMFGGRIRAWNCQFERLMFQNVMTRYGWPHLPTEQCVCTMTEAIAMALPGALGNCAAAIGLSEQKDQEGARIMLQLSKPRKPSKNDPRTRITPQMAPQKFERLYKYCQQDVRTECAIAKLVTRLKPSEQELYIRDQYIQDRGVLVDVPFVHRAKAIVEESFAAYDAEIKRLTNGVVPRVTNSKLLGEWLAAQGLDVEVSDDD